MEHPKESDSLDRFLLPPRRYLSYMWELPTRREEQWRASLAGVPGGREDLPQRHLEGQGLHGKKPGSAPDLHRDPGAWLLVPQNQSRVC